MSEHILIIHPKDNVAVALRNLKKDEILPLTDGSILKVLSDIAEGHKAALEDISAGAAVYKYGEIIGEAKAPIRKGEWVHIHNLDIQDKKEST